MDESKAAGEGRAVLRTFLRERLRKGDAGPGLGAGKEAGTQPAGLAATGGRSPCRFEQKRA